MVAQTIKSLFGLDRCGVERVWRRKGPAPVARAHLYLSIPPWTLPPPAHASALCHVSTDRYIMGCRGGKLEEVVVTRSLIELESWNLVWRCSSEFVEKQNSRFLNFNLLAELTSFYGLKSTLLLNYLSYGHTSQDLSCLIHCATFDVGPISLGVLGGLLWAWEKVGNCHFFTFFLAPQLQLSTAIYQPYLLHI